MIQKYDLRCHKNKGWPILNGMEKGEKNVFVFADIILGVKGKLAKSYMDKK